MVGRKTVKVNAKLSVNMAVSMENVSVPTNANAFLGTQEGAAVKI